jgi:YihY family inner membrane protein
MSSPLQPLLHRLDRMQRSHRPLAFMYGVVKKYGTDQGGSLAALITYYGFLSLFPLLLLVVTVVGILAGSSHRLAADVEHSALGQFPIIGSTLRTNVHALSARSSVALAIGIFGLLWGSLGGSQAGMHAMAEVWNLPHLERPGFVPRLVRSLSLLGVMAVFLLASTALAGVAAFGSGPSGAARAGAAVLSVLLGVALFVAAFRILTPKAVRLAALVPGAVAGGIAWAALQWAGTYLVGHQLRNANAVYGTFGLVLGLLWWIYLGAQVVVYAAEINVVHSRRLWPRSLVQPLTSAERDVLAAYAVQQRRRPEQRVSVHFDEGDR